VAFDYVDVGPDGVLEPGQGFWITQVTGGDVTLDLPEGSLETRSTGAAADACSSISGCLDIPLSGAPLPIDPNTRSPRLSLPNLIGNPYNQALTPFDDLFGDDITGGYRDNDANTGTWIVFTWDPVLFDYVDVGPNGVLEPGQGFWITQVTGRDITLDLPPGSLETRSTGAAADACSSDNGCLDIPLSGAPLPIDPDTGSPRLSLPNLIGNPYNQALTPFDDLLVTTTLGNCSIGSAGCTLDQATLPNSDGDGENVLGNVMFTFDPEQLNDDGSFGNYVSVTTGSMLNAWEGYWVFELPNATDNNPVVRFPDLRTPP